MRRVFAYAAVGAIALVSLTALVPPALAVEPPCPEECPPPLPRYPPYLGRNIGMQGFIVLSYGEDPIPAPTLSQRWSAWRWMRAAQQQGSFPNVPENCPRATRLPPTANSPRPQPAPARTVGHHPWEQRR